MTCLIFVLSDYDIFILVSKNNQLPKLVNLWCQKFSLRIHYWAFFPFCKLKNVNITTPCILDLPSPAQCKWKHLNQVQTRQKGYWALLPHTWSFDSFLTPTLSAHKRTSKFPELPNMCISNCRIFQYYCF